jgi:DNA-binding response OmpR family regulator
LNVELASSGTMAMERLASPGIDLLLLDLQLGDIDGTDVMQFARQRWPDLSIIMLTAHGSLPSAIAAVRAGAADYLLKPISMATLRDVVHRVLAERDRSRARGERLRAVYEQMDALMRSEGLLHAVAVSEPAPRSAIYESAPLHIDVQQHMVALRGQPIDVTPSEFAILLELLRVPGAVVACLRLARAINTVVDDEEEARQLIRPHIARLRRKLETAPQQPVHLISVRGVGYRWVGTSTGKDTRS